MVTPAIENLTLHYPNSQITLFGSLASIEAIKPHPNVEMVVADRTREYLFRMLAISKVVKELDRFDLAISFRSHIHSKMLLFLLKTERRVSFNRELFGEQPHQVEKYNRFISEVVGREYQPEGLKLYHKPHIYEKPTIGINPGATYGDAKRWYPERFAKVALEFKDRFNIVIFGGSREIEVANEIENRIIGESSDSDGILNLAGKTSISKLCSMVAGLNLLVTNDSGPMHIASAYRVPTVAIFGPTNHRETSQWQNPKGLIVRKELECSPCMRRSCPIKTHDCMRDLSENDVIVEIKKVLEEKV
jgi:heptosyltransferase-2